MGQVDGAIAIGVAAALGVAAADDPARPDRSWRAGVRKPAVADPAAAGRGVAGLPDARGRRFPTLDAYLAHLRAYAGPIDRPWYREVAPDRFELQRGTLRTPAPPPIFTRAELERKFGFRR